MTALYELLASPWPWYVAGPMIGLMIPLLLLVGNKTFGVSSSFRHTCSACMPSAKNIPYFNYNWKKEGGWNLLFVAGMIVGGFIGGYIFANPDPVELSRQTAQTLSGMGVNDFNGLIPGDLFNWQNLLSVQGIVVMVAGGFLVGFGARYAGGCTSGHGITGLSSLQKPSILAVAGFFAGGLIVSHFVLPLLLGM